MRTLETGQDVGNRQVRDLALALHYKLHGCSPDMCAVCYAAVKVLREAKDVRQDRSAG